jgi:exodeoxyribonuclease V alpha subunit
MNEPRLVIEGVVDHLRYVGPDGYTVACVALAERPGRDSDAGADDATVIAAGGALVGVQPGETVRLTGVWSRRDGHGDRFAVAECVSILPASVYAIRRYLGSGLIRGIGGKLADAIVGHFGERTLEIIDGAPERLVEVHNIGPGRMRTIVAAWAEQKAIREVMTFLQGVRVSPALAIRIHRVFGEDALRVVREEPYRLAEEVRGVGFHTADRIALSAGVPEQSPQRMRAGLLHVLERAHARFGHCFLPERSLIAQAMELLDADPEPLRAALDALRADGKAVVEPLPDRDGGGSEPEPVVFTRWLHVAESSVAGELIRLHRAASRLPERVRRAAAGGDRVEALHPDQRRAVETALRETVSVLTGGPGCGKSFTVRVITELARAGGARVALAAPTGRAAKRLSELTGLPAMTVHRMVRPREDPADDGALFDHEDPFLADLIVIDETSMLDLPIARTLLRKIPSGCHVLFVGDPDQLPSVGPGNVLGDLLDVPAIPRVRLTHVFRQSLGSPITANAHRVREGLLPYRDKDFYLIQEEDADAVPELVADLATRRIPGRLGVDPDDVQVLCPGRRKAAGAEELNRLLQERRNPPRPGVPEYWADGRVFRPGDKVMPIRNNYDKGTEGVFNGASGTITRLVPDERRLEIAMDDGQTVTYGYDELDEILHAYAITVHRSQGSEYPYVIIPLTTAAGSPVLRRDLLYTAITRARRMVVLVGQERALEIAVGNRGMRRNTSLAIRLNHLLPPPDAAAAAENVGAG